jgi:hypothetical protein
MLKQLIIFPFFLPKEFLFGQTEEMPLLRMKKKQMNQQNNKPARRHLKRFTYNGACDSLNPSSSASRS